jgi:SAM-dependent methyltransferase
MGNLRRKAPVTRWGWERGTPVDRYYIEQFIESHSQYIRGNVLEVKNRDYTERYKSAAVVSHVLDIDAANPLATVVADLASASHIPSNSFNCFILTQTLQYVYDTRGALAHAWRILKPGGVLLVTAPLIVRTDHSCPDYWRFTKYSAERLFGEAFGPANVDIRMRGNCVAAIAFLSGLAAEEFRTSELEHDDPNYSMVACIRAQKE